MKNPANVKGSKMKDQCAAKLRTATVYCNLSISSARDVK